MSNENVLLAELREETGKGSARRSRRAGLIPAVMYGHGTDPVHLNLPGHETFLITKDSANAIVTVKFDGKEQMVLIRDKQVHPVRRDILHIDLLIVRKGEKVQVEVPVFLVGEPAVGTQHQQEEFSLAVSAPATAIPENIEVSIEGLEAGTVLTVGDIALPAGVEAETPADRDVVIINEITEAAPEPTEGAEAAAE